MRTRLIRQSTAVAIERTFNRSYEVLIGFVREKMFPLYRIAQ